MHIDRQTSEPVPISGESPASDVQFGYFLLHTHCSNQGRALLRLTLEDLSSGTKSTFGSTRELKRYLDSWLHGPGLERWAPPEDRTSSDDDTNQMRGQP